MRNKYRKCLKCGSSPAEDPKTVLYRFVKPGPRNIPRSNAWARFVFPNEQWDDPELQMKLYSEHRMLCHRHFPVSQFVDYSRKKLRKHAWPREEVMEKLQAESDPKTISAEPLVEDVLDSEKESNNPRLTPDPLHISDSESDSTVPTLASISESTSKAPCELKMCRFCLSRDNLKLLFEDLFSREEVEAASGVTIPNDRLPQTGCTTCIYRIKDILSFRLMSEKSQEILQTVFKREDSSDNCLDQCYHARKDIEGSVFDEDRLSFEGDAEYLDEEFLSDTYNANDSEIDVNICDNNEHDDNTLCVYQQKDKPLHKYSTRKKVSDSNNLHKEEHKINDLNKTDERVLVKDKNNQHNLEISKTVKDSNENVDKKRKLLSQFLINKHTQQVAAKKVSIQRKELDFDSPKPLTMVPHSLIVYVQQYVNPTDSNTIIKDLATSSPTDKPLEQEKEKDIMSLTNSKPIEEKNVIKSSHFKPLLSNGFKNNNKDHEDAQQSFDNTQLKMFYYIDIQFGILKTNVLCSTLHEHMNYLIEFCINKRLKTSATYQRKCNTKQVKTERKKLFNIVSLQDKANIHRVIKTDVKIQSEPNLETDLDLNKNTNPKVPPCRTYMKGKYKPNPNKRIKLDEDKKLVSDHDDLKKAECVEIETECISSVERVDKDCSDEEQKEESKKEKGFWSESSDNENWDRKIYHDALEERKRRLKHKMKVMAFADGKLVDGKYLCKVCNKYVPEKKFKNHAFWHLPLKEVGLLCEQCGRLFRSKSGLEQHKQKHSSTRTHVCGNCNAVFPTSSALRAHKLVHFPSGTVVCDQCGNTFRNRSRLVSHLCTVHGLYTPTPCTICGKVFKMRANMLTHRFQSHNHFTYFCPVCPKTNRKREDLKRHIMKAHNISKDHIPNIKFVKKPKAGGLRGVNAKSEEEK